jgi:hypothetical protein
METQPLQIVTKWIENQPFQIAKHEKPKEKISIWLLLV